ncbi:MAG TPA: FtsQ-type POTRA domain-containing protein [Vicinamibacterales bacterium]|nr:FtsQ-type POTRA domain-containing protein [Vicinamibacterales bacterium]
MSPVTSLASDRRFRRAQVTPIRRRSKWYALAKRTLQCLVLAAVAASAAARAPALAARAHMLRVDRIVIHGNQRLSQGDVLAILTGLRGESLLWTDLDRWRRRLLASPWVRDAELRRSLPSTIDIAIAEREPIGIGRVNGDMYLVDDRGVIIDQYGPQYAQFDLPMIDGLSASPAEGGTMTDGARAELAARVIAAVAARPGIARRLSQIDVSDAHNASVILSGDPAVIRLGDDRFLQRVEAYLQLAPALRERVNEIDYVDLRFDDRIYVRPVNAKAARTSAAGRATGRRR